MSTLKVAHIREQGQDIVIVPLDNSFDHKSSEQQHDTIDELQRVSISAGLRGTVVPVWQPNSGGMKFIAPPQWHAFFKSINLGIVRANLNKQLSW